MKTQEKTTVFRMNIGGASIILILVVISMCIFAILSVRASYNELKLARNSRDYVEEYYRADAKAERFVAGISKMLSEGSDFYSAASETAASLAPEVRYSSIREDSAECRIIVRAGTDLVTVVKYEDGKAVCVKRALETEQFDNYAPDTFDGLIFVGE